MQEHWSSVPSPVLFHDRSHPAISLLVCLLIEPLLHCLNPDSRSHFPPFSARLTLRHNRNCKNWLEHGGMADRIGVNCSGCLIMHLLRRDLRSRLSRKPFGADQARLRQRQCITQLQLLCSRHHDINPLLLHRNTRRSGNRLRHKPFLRNLPSYLYHCRDRLRLLKCRRTRYKQLRRLLSCSSYARC